MTVRRMPEGMVLGDEAWWDWFPGDADKPCRNSPDGKHLWKTDPDTGRTSCSRCLAPRP